MSKVIPLMEKYRPRSLSDMVGQEDSVQVLQHDIRADAIKPLYIMHGTFGTGKTTAARAFARDYNCPNRQDGEAESCGECDSCIDADNGRARYITEINATENSSVDSVRDLLKALRIGGFGRRRFVILDEAHHMSAQAMDTLLKTCEDPNNDYTFIMVTSEKNRIRQGLISRASMIFMHPIDVGVIEERLRYICDAEGLDVSNEAIHSCAVRANGSMRTAINHLERASISGSDADEVDDGWEDYMDALAGDDVSRALVSVANLLAGDYTPIDVLTRSFASVRDAIVSGDDKWGVGLSRHAISELARAVQTMNSSGADRIVLEAAVVSIVNPPHRDVELQVKNAVERALSGIDIGGRVAQTVASTGYHNDFGSPAKELSSASTEEVLRTVTSGDSEGVGSDSAPEVEKVVKEDGAPVVDSISPSDEQGARETLESFRRVAGGDYEPDDDAVREVSRGMDELDSYREKMLSKGVPESRVEAKLDVRKRGARRVAEDLVRNSGVDIVEDSADDGLPDGGELLSRLREVKKWAEEDSRGDVLDVLALVCSWEVHQERGEIELLVDDMDYRASAVTCAYIAENVGCDKVSVTGAVFDDEDDYDD